VIYTVVGFFKNQELLVFKFEFCISDVLFGSFLLKNYNGPVIAHTEDANSLKHITQDYNNIARVVLCGIVQACQSFLYFSK
jgi:hypothetical protein